MKTKLTVNKMYTILMDNGAMFSTVSKSKKYMNAFVARKNFLYNNRAHAATKFTSHIQEVLEGAGYNVQMISNAEIWQTWPKNSYYEVTFRIVDGE